MKSAGEIPSEYYVSDEDEKSNSSGDEGNNENDEEAEEDDSSESSGFESDGDDESSTSSDESMIMPYTIDDIQLPPHPKRIKWSDEAFSSSTGDDDDGGDDGGGSASALLISTRLIPGGRLGRHFWTLDDVPEGSSFRFSNVSNKDRRRMRKERMHSVTQERKEEKKEKKEKADSASEAAPQCQCDGISSDMSPETTKITPDDCVSDHEDLDDIIGFGHDGNGDDDAESAASEGSGWGASRRLSDIGGDLEDDDDDDDDDEETDGNLAAGQRIEHSIQNMDTVQREKLVEAMMNDILKSMRAIEKRRREESEERQEKNDEEGMSIDSDPKHEEKSVDEDDVALVDPINEDDDKTNPGNEVKAGTEEEHSGSNEDESDFFVDLLTDENVDDFVQAQAVEWMDDAQKDDDDEDDDEGDEFDEFLESYSSSRLSDGEEDSGTNATGSLSPSHTNEGDELVFKHRFMDGGDDVVIDKDTADLKKPAVERRRKGSGPTAYTISHRSQRTVRPTLPPRQISSKRNLRDNSKSTSKNKKKKKSFAKRMFKISLQGEIDETKRKMEMRRHGSHASGFSDHDSISTDLNGGHGSFRSNATGRDSMSRLGGSGIGEQSMIHNRRPVPSGRHKQMQRSNNSGSTVSSGGSGGSVDASRRQHRHIPGGRSSVARGQGPRPPGSSRASTSSGRGRGPISRPPCGAAHREVASIVRGTGRGSGARGTAMRAPGRKARGAPPQRTNVRPSGRNSTSLQSKKIRSPTEGQRGHNLRTSLSSSGTGGKATTAASKGGRSNQQQQDATTEGEKKKKKKLFKLNLKSELVD